MSEDDEPGPEPQPPGARSRRKKLFFGVLFLLFSSGLALGAIELFARAFDPFGISYYKDTNRYLNEAIVLPPDAGRADGRLFENKPGADMRLRSFDFRTGALGLRAASVDEAPLEDRGETKRILFLGDSVTLAWGVNDEDSWIRIVEREGKSAGGHGLECLNAGHLQYNTVQEADWLAAHGPELAPDLVVLTFVVNDLDDAYALYLRFLDDVANAKPREEQSWRERLDADLPVWFRGTHGLLTLWRERQTARTSSERRDETIEDQPGYAEGWQRCSAGLERMRSLCAEIGADFVVLDHSMPRIGGVQTWCEENGVPWFDFVFSDEEWARGLTNSPADAHANALGNRILADKALDALATTGHLRARAPRDE